MLLQPFGGLAGIIIKDKKARCEMDKAYEIHQNFRIKYLVAGLVACLLAAGIFGCGKGDVARQNSQADLSSWTGTYVYGATFPHALEENGDYFIGYTVTVYEDKGAYYADVTANGWQICSESLARVEGDENRIEFLFVKTLPKDSRYGKSERYEKDEVMLSFTRKDERIQTGWGVLRKEHPVFIESEEVIAGEYFLKETDEVSAETNSALTEKEISTPKPLPIPISTPIATPKPATVPTASPVPSKEPTPRPKGDFPERSYESIREFPYETMEFADEMTYAFIKQAYDAFAFDAEFKTGDPVLYDSYLDEFRKLVNNEMPFTVQGMQDSFYFKEYGGMEPAEDEEFKPEDFEYYVFDVNGDSTPELCVMVPGWGTYVFRYDAANSQMRLLLEMNYYEGFLGTGILYCNNFGLSGRDLNTVYHIDEKGSVIAKVFFCEEVFHSNGVETYMVALTEYINADESLEIPMEMKAMAYYSEEDGLYLFKVTARQYEQLNGDYTYVEGWAQADDEVEKMICTYEELFPEKSREETMAYMFRFLCSDQSVMKDLEIYTENDKMYYKWREEYASGEVSDPYVLESRNVTPDGLYHEYGLYHEIWNRNGEDRVHVRNDYHNWWFVNAQTLELVPWWMSNPEAEKEEDSVWENEKYFEIVGQLNLYG